MSVKRGNVYRCEKCGNIAHVLKGGGPVLHCCKEPMVLLTENTTDAAQEKHVPVVAPTDGGFKVTVGEVNHPMQTDHYIEWIELVADGISYYKFMEPDAAPEAVFAVEAENAFARAYCNLHGLWKG